MTKPDAFWIGHPGALLPLPDRSVSLKRKTSRKITYRESASGRRRGYLAAGRAPLREWSVSISRLRTTEAAVLHGLLMGTDPPYVWVDPWSRVTNLLTPAAAGLQSTVPLLPKLGRQPLDGGGWAPTAVANPSGGLIRVEPAPIVPGIPVTLSAFLSSPSTARLSAQFLDTAGAVIGDSVTSDPVAGSDVLRRAHVTVLDPPLGAAAVQILLLGAAVASQPAVTWTADLLPYGAAGGAAQVAVDELDETVVQAMSNVDGERRADMSFTVTEVA